MIITKRNRGRPVIINNDFYDNKTCLNNSDSNMPNKKNYYVKKIIKIKPDINTAINMKYKDIIINFDD
jgi:hypothetical protein